MRLLASPTSTSTPARPPSLVVAGGVAASIACGIVAPGLLVESQGLVIAAVLALVIVFSVHRTGTVLLVPGAIVAGVYLATVALGPPVYDATWRAEGASVVLDPYISRGVSTAILFAAAGIFVTVGSLVGSGAFRRSTKRDAKLGSQRRRTLLALSRATAVRSLVLSAAPLALMLVTGQTQLLERPTYLSEFQVGGIWAVAETLSLPALAILGFVLSASSGKYKAIAIGLLMSYAAVFVSTGSRRIALIFPFVLVGFMAARPWTRRSTLLAILAVVQAAILFPLPLALRALPSHGLLPYTSAIVSGDLDTSKLGLDAVGRNLAVSYPLAAQVAFNEPHLPLHYFVTSVSPLPGGMTDWYSIAPRLRLNPATPYSAIGELGNYGLWVIAVYMFTVGLVLGLLIRLVATTPPGWHPYLRTVVAGSAVMFAILSLQYNLRSVSRLVIYATLLVTLAAAISWWLVPRIQVGRRSSP